MKYDSETGDYFYSGFLYPSPNKHFISRYSGMGELIWGKLNSEDGVNYNTLQYSPLNQVLYDTLSTLPVTLITINSSNGEYLNTYQLPDL